MRVFHMNKTYYNKRSTFQRRGERLLFFQSILIVRVASTVQSTRTYIYFVKNTTVKFIHVINGGHKILNCGRSVAHRNAVIHSNRNGNESHGGAYEVIT